MKVVLIGPQGQTGSFLEETFRSFFPDSSLIALPHEELDLSQTEKIRPCLLQFGKIDGIINAAAYTAVDLAEKERDKSEKINHIAVRELAGVAKENDAWIVHFSTDYVYEGLGSTPQDESTPIHPLNYYAETKARGDDAIIALNPKHLIFRTSWVYSEKGKNFLLTMIRLFLEKTEVSVVCDQVGAPTYARDLADESLKALSVALSQPSFPSGVYHLTNLGACSWFEFAEAILDNLEEAAVNLKLKDLISIPSSQYPSAAKRPKNSRLSLDRFKGAFGFQPRPWRDALNDCMKNLSL